MSDRPDLSSFEAFEDWIYGVFVKERERRRIIYDLLRELEADRERLAGVLEYTEVRLAEWSGTDDALPFDAKMSAVERLCRAAREREGSREGE